MFDRSLAIVTDHAPRSVDVHATITEKRAPTDDSVRLLAEMEAKARDRIIDRLVSDAGENTIGAVVVEEVYDTRRIGIAFRLNGVTIMTIIEPVSLSVTGKEAAARHVADAVGAAIAREIVSRNMVRFRG